MTLLSYSDQSYLIAQREAVPNGNKLTNQSHIHFKKVFSERDQADKNQQPTPSQRLDPRSFCSHLKGHDTQTFGGEGIKSKGA